MEGTFATASADLESDRLASIYVMYWHLSGCQEAVAVFSKLLQLRPSRGSAGGPWQLSAREAGAEATVRGTWARQLTSERAAPPD